MSAGPFTFLPGEMKEVIIGVIWARAREGGPLASVQKMKDISDSLNFSKSIYYADMDNDGFGDPSYIIQDYIKPRGFSSSATDCNDADSTIHPGASEISDGLDNNCDGKIDNTLPIAGKFSEDYVNIQIMPNPITHILNITFKNRTSDEKITVKLFEMNGKLVFSKTVSISKDIDLISLDVSHLKEGVYLAIISGEIVNTKKKFIVLR